MIHRLYPRLRLVLFAVWALSSLSSPASDYPPPNWAGGGELRSMGLGLQRTMNLLASSTSDHRNTVRVLFYGQSITEQSWWKLVAEDLRGRFPHASLIIENRAIGGHAAQLLVKTAEADLYPFYPDLVIFHVYGSHIEYENIIRRIRERTTAEILLQTDHVTRDEQRTEETDPEKLTPQNWDAFMNYRFLPEISLKYGAELAGVRDAWKHYLRDYAFHARDFLKDGVHLNEPGCVLMAECLKPWLRLNPAVDDGAWKTWVRTLTVGKDVTWSDDRLTLEFEGNRLDAIASGVTGGGEALEVWIDGKRPSEDPRLRTFNRVSAFPGSNWPCLLRVQSEAPLLVEDWTLTLTEVSDDLKTVRFTLKGSKTGDDGEGVSTERFVSRTGRIVLEPDDWNLGYCRAVFQRSLESGYTIRWKVLPWFQDTFLPAPSTDPTLENTVTLAQGLGPGVHRLELRGASKANLAALRVYRPPGRVRQTESP